MLVTEVNSQSWQIRRSLPLPDFYLHKIRMWHHPKKMCPHKISLSGKKMHFPLCYFVLHRLRKGKNKTCSAEQKGLLLRLAIWLSVITFADRPDKCPWCLKQGLMVEFAKVRKCFLWLSVSANGLSVGWCFHQLFCFLVVSQVFSFSIDVHSSLQVWLSIEVFCMFCDGTFVSYLALFERLKGKCNQTKFPDQKFDRPRPLLLDLHLTPCHIYM